MSRLEEGFVLTLILAGVAGVAFGFFLLIRGAIEADACRAAGGVVIQGACSRTPGLEPLVP